MVLYCVQEVQQSLQLKEEEVEEFLIDVIKTRLVRAKIAQVRSPPPSGGTLSDFPSSHLYGPLDPDIDISFFLRVFISISYRHPKS